jgi:hypothetical protein
MFIDKLVRIFIVSSIFLAGIETVNANSRSREVRVMTYNMYLGTDFTEIFSAQSNEELISEVAEAYGDVQAGNPAERIAAIAGQIEATTPTLVGLQEVALWRTGNAFDPSPATSVSYDFLQMLLDELAGRGIHYSSAVVQTGFDAELPALGPNVFADVRYTDRNVILARTDLDTSQLKIEGTNAQDFQTLLTLPLFIGNVTIQRGWTSVDAQIRGKGYRFINAHTEAFHPGVEYAQSAELLLGPASTTLPVILAGDLNTDAENSGASYMLFQSAGFDDTWTVTHPADSAYTWPLFTESPDIITSPTQRLDLILIRGSIAAADADMVGEDPVLDLTPSGLRPSDHAGATASLFLQP